MGGKATVEIQGKETVSKAAKEANAALRTIASGDAVKGIDSLVNRFGGAALAAGTAVVGIKAVVGAVGSLVTAYAEHEAVGRAFEAFAEIFPAKTPGADRRQ